MAQTYEQGFKEGVEAAGRKIFEELPLSGITDPVDVLNAIPRFLRKKLLLTKKVTKWGMVVSRPQTGGEASYGVYGNLRENKTSAEETIVYSGDGTHIVGVYPIEIEVPL